jgi:glycosyltransferase involved in cell wall biosynthesis
MRVAIVTNTYPPHDISGVGTLCSELAVQLPAAGHEAVVLTRRAAPDTPEGRAARTTDGSKLLFPLAVARLYLREVRKHGRFDIVHVHESDGFAVALLVRLARLLRRPSGPSGRTRLIATLQVSYRRERLSVRPIYAHGGPDGGGPPVSRPTRSERLFAYVRAPILSGLGRLTARLADRVVAPSHETARELVEDYGARDVAVVPNGVTLPERAPERPAGAPAPAGPFTILYAGRLRTRKAVAVLLEAFARLRERVPEARLVLVGDGEQRPALEAQAGRLGIADAVSFEGGRPHGAMPEYYRAADVFCLPSLYEGFPLAILEAMAAGLPVVATAVAGVPEAVADGTTGRVVPAEDAPALADVLAELAADRGRARAMGEAGRERAEREFAIPKIASDYLAVWLRSM